MTDTNYMLERDSRIMSYLPGGDSIGGMVGTPIELTLDQVSDECFAVVDALVKKIQANKLSTQEIGISGDFRWCVEIGPKDTPAHKLTPIFQSETFQLLPRELLQLHETLKAGIRESEGRAPFPVTKLTFD